MLWKKIAAATALGTGLAVAAPAFADPPYWAPAHGWRHHHPYRGYYAPRVVIVPPAPYYLPPPVAYTPPVVVYPAPAYPVYPGVSLRIGVRL